MNAGFTKIYSLLLDGFPIYDSRVAASLAYLVRLYCEEAGLARLPPALAFGIPASRGSGNRDPSIAKLRFPRLWAAQPRKYADSNLRAAWLLGQVSRLGPFGDLPREQALRALEAALFMVGFHVPGDPVGSVSSQTTGRGRANSIEPVPRGCP